MSITLKNGSVVEDPRLDFLPYKDERSRDYPAVEMIEDPTLQYRNYFPGYWLDQGTDGACVAFSICHELVSSPVRFTKGITELAAREIYHDAQHQDVWRGCHKGPACDKDPSREKYEGTSMLAGLDVAKKRGYIKEYRWAFGEEDLALSLSNLGPAVIGVNWYSGMFQPDKDLYLQMTGSIQGGHAVLVAGFDPKRERYRIWNSWGKSWGLNGWAFISRKTMDNLLKQDGEAGIPVERSEQ